MATDTPHNEKELLLLVAEGDEIAFRQLFETYTPKLKAFFLRMTKEASLARELVQETFLNIWLYRTSLAAVEKPSTYIYRVASNVAITHFRKEDLRRKLVTVAMGSEPTIQPDTLDILQLKEIQANINMAVKQLPPQQQEVFRLGREQGLSGNDAGNRNKEKRRALGVTHFGLSSFHFGSDRTRHIDYIEYLFRVCAAFLFLLQGRDTENG